MLVTLLSFPDNWDFSIAGLTKILPDGKSSVSASIDRLIQLGYLTKEQERTSLGKFGMNVIEVHETPISPLPEKPPTENRVTDSPVTGKSVAENQSQLSNNRVTNNKVINKESESLSDSDYNELVATFGRDNVDYQIRKIKEKHYKGCMNRSTIEKWCKEYQVKVKPPKEKNSFNNFPQRDYDWDKLERELITKSMSNIGGVVNVGK